MASPKGIRQRVLDRQAKDAPQQIVKMPDAIVSTNMEKPHFVEHRTDPDRCPFCHKGTLTPTDQKIEHEGITLTRWQCDVCPYGEGR